MSLRWLASLFLCVNCTVAAQQYPDRPINLIVAYPPGEPTARMSTEQKAFAQVVKDANIHAE